MQTLITFDVNQVEISQFITNYDVRGQEEETTSVNGSSSDDEGQKAQGAGKDRTSLQESVRGIVRQGKGCQRPSIHEKQKDSENDFFRILNDYVVFFIFYESRK